MHYEGSAACCHRKKNNFNWARERKTSTWYVRGGGGDLSSRLHPLGSVLGCRLFVVVLFCDELTKAINGTDSTTPSAEKVGWRNPQKLAAANSRTKPIIVAGKSTDNDDDDDTRRTYTGQQSSEEDISQLNHHVPTDTGKLLADGDAPRLRDFRNLSFS